MVGAAPGVQGGLMLPWEVSRHLWLGLGSWVIPHCLGLGWHPGVVVGHSGLDLHQWWWVVGLWGCRGGLVAVGAVSGNMALLTANPTGSQELSGSGGAFIPTKSVLVIIAGGEE